MTGPEAGRITRIAAAIADYLARHPNARDSARGIRDCWLPEDLQSCSPEEVERALHELVEGGRMDAITVPHNPTLFARARRTPTPPANRGKPRA